MNTSRLTSALLPLLLLGCTTSPAFQQSTPQPKFDKKAFGQPQISTVTGTVPVLHNAHVINFGKEIYVGDIDVNVTLDRIRSGKHVSEPHDGAVFNNRERRLPVKDRAWYREFVHAPKGFPFPGPQRVILGKSGEVYYTGDHYKSFTKVN